MQAQINKSNPQNNYNELFFTAKCIEEKIDFGISNNLDFETLQSLSNSFSILGYLKESLFCRKLAVKHLLIHKPKSDVAAINQIHNLVVELIADAESHKIFIGSFYNLTLKVKAALLNLLQHNQEDYVGVKNSAKYFLAKSKAMFPTYSKLNNYNF